MVGIMTYRKEHPRERCKVLACAFIKHHRGRGDGLHGQVVMESILANERRRFFSTLQACVGLCGKKEKMFGVEKL